MDKTFVDGVDPARRQRAGAHDHRPRARRCDLDIIAEGIETGAQLKRLRSLDCEFGQGYQFARPLDGAELTAYLQRTARGCSGARRSSPGEVGLRWRPADARARNVAVVRARRVGLRSADAEARAQELACRVARDADDDVEAERRPGRQVAPTSQWTTLEEMAQPVGTAIGVTAEGRRSAKRTPRAVPGPPSSTRT